MGNGPSLIDGPDRLPPLSLAYIGDAVFEVYVREHLLRQGIVRVEELHRRAVDFVSAGGQARALAAVESLLTEEELAVWKRGRNAKGGVPRHTGVAEYRQSTGLEALVGWLYLAGRKGRLDELMSAIISAREGQAREETGGCQP